MPEKSENRNALALARGRQEQTVALRRWFHAHPELSGRETATTDKITACLDELGIPWKRPGETGVVATLRGGRPGRTLGLRADIDALPVAEQTGLPFASQNPGVMHACGHDGHITALLTAAALLRQEQDTLPGTVKLIFQPAEETGSGAEKLIQTGLLENVDAFFGIHVTPLLQAGQISVVQGPIMAGANRIRIRLTGRSAHGALPAQSIDTVVAGSAVVQALQEVVAREHDPALPAVVTIGSFHAGAGWNIIAGQADLEGTLRIVTEESRAKLSAAVRRVVENVARAYRVGAEAVCEYATPIVDNHPQLFPIVRESAAAILSPQALRPLPISMLADDFAAYGRLKPAFYAKVGVAAPEGEAFPLHHSRFTLDENSLPVAAALFVEFTRRYLRSR